MQDPSLNPNTLVKSATLNLLAGYSSANLTWTLTIDSSYELVSGEKASGSGPAYSTAAATFKKLTAVQEASDSTKVWNIGYFFDLNQADSNEPQLSAVWWEDGTPQIKDHTYFYSSPSVTPDSKDKTATEDADGSNQNNYISITVDFDD